MPTAIGNLDASRLVGTRFGDVRVFDEIGSTNAELLSEARRGAPEGVVVVADHQSAGRGRLGREWAAAPGTSLLVSVLLRPVLPPEQLPLVTMAAGLAAVDGVEAAAGFRPGLKWPNDLVVDDRKLAGMLSESDTGPGGGDRIAVVVGVGVNVAEGAYPLDMTGTATTCEAVAGRPVHRTELLVAFLRALEGHYSMLLERGPDAVLASYRAWSATLGRHVRVEVAGAVIEGRADDLGPDGSLVVVDAAGALHRVDAGDVIHLRPA